MYLAPVDSFCLSFSLRHWGRFLFKSSKVSALTQSISWLSSPSQKPRFWPTFTVSLTLRHPALPWALQPRGYLSRGAEHDRRREQPSCGQGQQHYPTTRSGTKRRLLTRQNSSAGVNTGSQEGNTEVWGAVKLTVKGLGAGDSSRG